MYLNTWTKTAPITQNDGPNEPGIDGEVIPAEIGLIEMNLRDGLTNRFYQMVNPGPLQLGYRGDMMVRSEKTHQIWLDNPALSDDYLTIIEKIRATLKVDESHNTLNKGMIKEKYAGQDCNALSEFKKLNVDELNVPKGLISSKKYNLLPVYVMPFQQEDCRNALEWLRKKANVEYSFCLYTLPTLLVHLVQQAPLEPENSLCFTTSIAEANLERDVFLYVKGVSCPYHDKKQNNHCAGGAASRLGYIVCDFACKLYNIKILEGYHLPSGVRIQSNDATEFFTQEHNSLNQIDSITDASWDNDSDAIWLPDHRDSNKKTLDSTLGSQRSSQTNPYTNLMEDFQIATLSLHDRDRHALAVDVQEVTEHILAPLFNKCTAGLGSKSRLISMDGNDTEYQSFVSSAQMNSTLNSNSAFNEGPVASNINTSQGRLHYFRPLHELILKSDYRVHPPPCHKQFEGSKGIATIKRPTLLDKNLPPIAKSAFAAEKLKSRQGSGTSN